MPRRSSHKRLRPLFLTILLGFYSADQAAMAVPRDAATGDDILLEVRPKKTRAYLHEAVPVTVTLLVGAASVRNIGYPRVDSGIFRATEFSPPRQSSVIHNGREYATYEFSATLNPRKSGEVEWGPVELHYDRLLPGDGAAAFFGGNEPHAMTARSSPVAFSILPLPTRGRPVGFAGAVGHFAVDRHAKPMVLHTGDPFVVMTHITGVGNIDKYSCESVSLPGVRAYPPKVVRAPNRLNCEQVLLIETAVGKIIIPAASISFFDPRSERYRTASSQAITLTSTGVAVHSAQVVAPASVVPAYPVSVDSTRWPLWVALAVVPLALALAIRRKSRRLRLTSRHNTNAPVDARRLLTEAEAGLAADDSPRFYEAAFRLVQLAAAEQCRLPSSGLTLSAMARDGEPMPRHIVALFQECDAVRYGGAIRDRQEMLRTLKYLQAHIAKPL